MATTQLAALGVLALAGFSSAQWADLPSSFTDIDQIINPNELESGSSTEQTTTTTIVRNNCFQVSQIMGRSDGDTSFATDLSKLKAQYQDQMKLSKLKMCGTEAGFTGIQSIVEDDTRSIELTQFGSSFQCQTWSIPEGSYIRTMFFAYNANKITYVKASTEENFNFERGQQAADDKTYTVTFGRYEPLAGFAGYVENNQVAALGFFKYMCAERPEDLDNGLIEDDTEDQETDGSGDQSGTGTETGTDTGSTTETETGSGGSTSTEDGKNDQTGNQSSPGDSKDDSALDPNQTRENSLENQLISINDDLISDQEESSGLSLILIILIIILIPLVCVLCCIVYMFRKNRINSVEAGITRRTSTLKRRLSMDHDAIMEGKKRGPVDIFANDLEKNSAHKGLLPGDDEKVKGKSSGILDQVPDESQIEELLRGKSAAERKKLLREIEKARQAKIHMTYLMEQQKLKNEERWAIRNIEEREAIQNIYSDHRKDQRPLSGQPQSQIQQEDRNEDGYDQTHEPKSGTLDAPESHRSEEPEVGERQVSSARKNMYDDDEYEVAAPPVPAVSNDQQQDHQYNSNNQQVDDEEFNF